MIERWWMRGIVVVAAVLALGSGPADAGAGRPSAEAAKACALPKYPGSGYFTLLRVKRTDCKAGKALALAYYKCRTDNGGISGTCDHKVNRYTCTEHRESIPTEIDAKVTCKRGKRRIVHAYQQNT